MSALDSPVPLDVGAARELIEREIMNCVVAIQGFENLAKHGGQSADERRCVERTLNELAVWRSLASSLAALGQSQRDTERLDWLEEAARSGRCGNGLVFMPTTLVKTGERRMSIIDLGDEDGSDLGEEIADAPTIREAIDDARRSAPDPERSTPA